MHFLMDDAKLNISININLPPFIGPLSESDDSENNDDNNSQIIYEPTVNPYFKETDIKILKINCGKHHSLVLSDRGKCFAFGYNRFGNLGNGSNTPYGQGVSVPKEIPVTDIIDHDDIITDFSCGLFQTYNAD